MGRHGEVRGGEGWGGWGRVESKQNFRLWPEFSHIRALCKMMTESGFEWCLWQMARQTSKVI
jgi:hypothetical protein